MSPWPWRATAAAALAVTAFGFVQTATPHPVGVDGLFHMQSASLVRDNTLRGNRLPPPLLQAIASSPAFETVYSDGACVVVQAHHSDPG